jgi:hypothetical protein
MSPESSRRIARQRGFTLAELMIYLALLVAGTVMIAGLELTASRAAFLERALVDLGLEAEELGGRFREDVFGAVRVDQGKIANGKGTLLVLGTPGGGEVRWEVEGAARAETVGPVTRIENARLVRRAFAQAGAAPTRVQTFAFIERLALTRSGRSLRLDLTLAASRGDEITARRSYQLAASPVAEAAP